ncbi:MAG: hypothetical protein ACYDH6_19725 [Acidimicrobiales bacterium]
MGESVGVVAHGQAAGLDTEPEWIVPSFEVIALGCELTAYAGQDESVAGVNR